VIFDDLNLEKYSLDEIYQYYLAIDENLPLDVHLSMFIPVIMYHTSDAQRDRWLRDAKTFRIIGAYAQTELGHGSSVRFIETTSTYDVERQEFIIHSPSISSAKWWPGG
jgi:acyl-CoA oxidase